MADLSEIFYLFAKNWNHSKVYTTLKDRVKQVVNMGWGHLDNCCGFQKDLVIRYSVRCDVNVMRSDFVRSEIEIYLKPY